VHHSCSKKRQIKNTKAGHTQLQKEVIFMQNQPSCEKSVQPEKNLGEKRCEIRRGSQEMAMIIV